MGARATETTATDGNGAAARAWAWVCSRRGRAVFMWMVTLGAASGLMWHSFIWFDSPSNLPEERRRADGNGGHVQIDFGGQWMMGRMVALGHARELYHRQRQWAVAWEAFPVEGEPPLCQKEAILPKSQRQNAKADEDVRHDAERLLDWFMGADSDEWRVVGGAAAAPVASSGNPLFGFALQAAAGGVVTKSVAEKVNAPAIGGPLYPPIHGFFYAPLGLIDRPQQAYHVFQVLAMGGVFFAGLGVSVLTRGRIWWSVATLALLFYPGTRAGLDLGQNPTLTLCIVVWGWVLASRGYNTAGGMVWGLLAFKPVWGLAFALVPILTRRWRFVIAMGLTGIGLAAATLPFVGIQTWYDWLAVGKEAAAMYNVNRNWIVLSRDLHGIPRRILHDFSRPEAERETLLARTLAWALWGTVVGLTAAIFLRYGDRKRATGVGIAFVLFGASLTAYRFMYYDVLLSALAFAALLAEPVRLLQTRVFALQPVLDTPMIGGSDSLTQPAPANPLGPRWMGYLNSLPLTVLALLYFVENGINALFVEATLAFGHLSRVTTGTNGATSIYFPKLVADTTVNYPLDTYLVLIIWAWCGIQLMRGRE